MSKHTPGPFELDESFIITKPIFFRPHTLIATVCMIHDSACSPGSESECLANAKLLIAAPELLSACEALIESISSAIRTGEPIDRRIIMNAKDAIAKAKGE